jgi:hypothetical protein
MHRLPAGALAAFLAALLAAPAGAQSPSPPPPPGREMILPPSEVRDTFFAYLVGIVDAGLDAELDNATLRSVLTEFQSTIALPFDRISVVRHLAPRGEAGSSGAGSLEIVFDGDLDVPVPFSLLGYHPGSLRSTRTVRFEELRYPLVPVRGGQAGPVYSFRIIEGAMTIDVDAWIDVLLGSIVDDLDVRLVAIARWKGAWRCILGGTGREGRRIIAAFDLTRNTISFPVPSELIRLGLDLWNAR